MKKTKNQYKHLFFTSFSLKIISIIFFSFLNFLTKKSNIDGKILFCVQSFSTALCLSPFARSYTMAYQAPWLWLLRLVLGSISSLLWIFSLKKLSLFDTMSLQFLSPVATVLGSVFFLHEKITPHRMTAIILSILGGGLMLWGKSTTETMHTLSFSFLPILASISCASVNILTKKIGRPSNGTLLILQQMVFNGVVLLPFCIRSDTSFWSLICHTDTLISLAGITLCTACAHLCLHHAIVLNDLTMLIPIGGLRPILTIVYGIIWLNERPSFISVCGTSIIMASLFMLSTQSKK